MAQFQFKTFTYVDMRFELSIYQLRSCCFYVVFCLLFLYIHIPNLQKTKNTIQDPIPHLEHPNPYAELPSS